MSDKILDRIEKLIQLATKNPNIEEARSAAMMALRLMETHHVVLSLPRQAPAAAPAAPTIFTDAMLADLMRTMRDAAKNQPPRAAYGANDSSSWYGPYEPPTWESPFGPYEPPKWEPPW